MRRHKIGGMYIPESIKRLFKRCEPALNWLGHVSTVLWVISVAFFVVSSIWSLAEGLPPPVAFLIGMASVAVLLTLVGLTPWFVKKVERFFQPREPDRYMAAEKQPSSPAQAGHSGSNLPDKRRRVAQVLAMLDELIETIPSELDDPGAIHLWKVSALTRIREAIQDPQVPMKLSEILQGWENAIDQSEYAIKRRFAEAKAFLQAFKARVREQDIRVSY